jgi:hypothetical protein
LRRIDVERFEEPGDPLLKPASTGVDVLHAPQFHGRRVNPDANSCRFQAQAQPLGERLVAAGVADEDHQRHEMRPFRAAHEQPSVLGC